MRPKPLPLQPIRSATVEIEQRHEGPTENELYGTDAAAKEIISASEAVDTSAFRKAFVDYGKE